MDLEIEAKFIQTNHDDVRRKLSELGAVCAQPLRLMRRVVFESPEMLQKDAFMRVRDEGNAVTLTYKQFNDADSITGVQELETVVENFETAVAILAATGLTQKSYQEMRRETWHLGDVEIMLDEWPWLAPFIEIEGPSETRVRAVAEQVGFAWDAAVFGGVASVYFRQYPQLQTKKRAAEVINRELKTITFERPLPAKLTGS